jgi:opacity protein-like surface antigen
LITNASSSVTLSHRFSAKNTVSISGHGSIVKFQVANGVPLSPLVAQESFSNGVTVRWDDEFIPRHKLGLEFGEQYFGFLSPASHSHYQFIKARYSQSFGRDYQVSLGAGPSRRERQTSAIFGGGNSEALDYALDASLTKSTQRQSLGITYSHGTQLGLSQGSLGSDSLSFSAARSLGRKWRLNGGFGFSRSESQTILVQSISRSYSTNAGVEYELRPDLSLTAGYSYMNQDVEQNLPGAIPFDRNVFRAGVRYTFQKVASR